MSNDIKQFVVLSKYAGERFDLVQAGGGNTSVQLSDGTFLVKASGINLSEVTADKGFVRLNRQEVLSILEDKNLLAINDLAKQEQKGRELLSKAQMDANRPSIEAYMHVLFDKFTLHTHSLPVNIVACQAAWRERFLKLFKDALCIDYVTPGIRLALAIKEASATKKSNIVFIQNHGLITSGSTAQAVIKLTEEVIAKVEQAVDYNATSYKMTTAISGLVNRFSKSQLISYLSTDRDITNILKRKPELLLRRPFSPDGITFCGVTAVKISHANDAVPVKKYLTQYGVLPKVIICKGEIFLLAPTVRKAKEIEDVLRFQLLVFSKAGRNVQSLSKTEMNYLTHWEAETYRQQL